MSDLDMIARFGERVGLREIRLIRRKCHTWIRLSDLKKVSDLDKTVGFVESVEYYDKDKSV